MNVLSKDVLYYWVYPKPVLMYIPAYSYIEYRRSTTITTTTKLTVNPPKVKQPNTNETIIITGDAPGDSIKISGQVTSGGTVVKVIVKVPESYYWNTPTPYIKEYNVIGWNGSAISKESFSNYGEAEFSIDSTSVGVMVGLTSSNNAAKNSGYNFISYAIYGNLGKYSIYVLGKSVGIVPKIFTSSDKFKIIINKNSIRFLFNNIEVYASSDTTELTSYCLDTSLYTSYDKVLNASIRQISYPNIGVHTKKQYVIIDGIRFDIINNTLFFKGQYYSVITTGFVYIDGILYFVQNGKIFFDGLYFSVIDGIVTVDGIHGESYTIDYSPNVVVDNNVYSVFTEPLIINEVEYPEGYWSLGLGNNLSSVDYSSLVSLLSLNTNIQPFYDLTNELVLENLLMYSGGSYFNNSFALSNYIEPYYGLFSELILESNLNYVGYSFISNGFVLGSILSSGLIKPSIPPILTCGFSFGVNIKNYFSEDPSLFIIT